MFKNFALVSGVICVITGMLASINDYIGLIVVLAGLLVTWLLVVSEGEKSRDQERSLESGAFFAGGILIMAAGAGIMPMDGDWFLFWVTGALSLALTWWAARMVYNLRANLNDKVSWKDINHIAVSLGLPVLGLSLVRYLVETDRSVVSSLIMVAVLAAFGYMLAPRSVVRIHQPKPLRRETTV